MPTLPLFVVLLGACGASGPVTGVLQDARTGLPMEGMLVVASGTEPCPPTEARTDSRGAFALASACPGAVIAPADPSWQLEGPVPAGPALVLSAWPGPPATGVALLHGTTIEPLRTHTALDTVYDGPTEILTPVELPGDRPRIDQGTTLVLRGREVLDRWTWAPILAAGPREFGPSSFPIRFGAWFYLGRRFDPPETVAAAPVILREILDLRYLDDTAFPPGEYALVHPARTRAFLFRFGAAVTSSSSPVPALPGP